MRLLLLLLLTAGCGGTSVASDGGGDAGPPYRPTEARLLGLNDVTWLLPLEAPDAGSPFPAPEALLPRANFERLTTLPGDVAAALSQLRVVALRVDLCDRPTTAPCAPGADGMLRLVLQPVLPGPWAADVALHAFYPLPAAELPALVDELRALARLQDVPRAAALRVNTAFTSSPEYRARLGALVSTWASAPRLHRLTLFGQVTHNAALEWVFRGEEKRGAGFVPIVIPAVADTTQQVAFFGATSYTGVPLADAPAGFQRAMLDTSFRAGTAEEQREALEALAAVDNPTLHTADTVQCVTCHVATTLLGPRAADAGVALTSLTARYTSTTFDLTPLGVGGVRELTLRALGYLGEAPLVAQRVVNETANVLGELEARFPAAP